MGNKANPTIYLLPHISYVIKDIGSTAEILPTMPGNIFYAPPDLQCYSMSFLAHIYMYMHIAYIHVHLQYFTVKNEGYFYPQVGHFNHFNSCDG